MFYQLGSLVSSFRKQMLEKKLTLSDLGIKKRGQQGNNLSTRDKFSSRKKFFLS
jgi:hypothetical protein